MLSKFYFQKGPAGGHPFCQPVWWVCEVPCSNPLPFSSPELNPSEPLSSSTPSAGRQCRSCPPPCGHPHPEDGPYSPESSGAELFPTSLLDFPPVSSVTVKTVAQPRKQSRLPPFALGPLSLASPAARYPSGHFSRRWVRNIQMFSVLMAGLSLAGTHALGCVLLPPSGDRWAGMRQCPLQGA